jgi:hypothetical protein
MNAPATPGTVRPEVSASPAPGLRAWDLIHKLVSFDTTR